MNTHPYLRAYMAGITVPSAFLLVILTVFVVARHVYLIPIPIEKMIVFPMAVLPNAFGAWNMLYARLSRHRYLPIGVHGAILPFLLAPLALATFSSLGFVRITSQGFVWFEAVPGIGPVLIPYTFFATVFLVPLIIYYLIWKYLVGFLNEVLGIA